MESNQKSDWHDWHDWHDRHDWQILWEPSARKVADSPADAFARAILDYAQSRPNDEFATKFAASVAAAGWINVSNELSRAAGDVADHLPLDQVSALSLPFPVTWVEGNVPDMVGVRFGFLYERDKRDSRVLSVRCAKHDKKDEVVFLRHEIIASAERLSILPPNFFRANAAEKTAALVLRLITLICGES
ncbi:conserved protein of unknown function [Rhodovastum atsumiense]|uniref:Uncharacterized protein n=1 Tax=Rhodovastum atsumiense TaxID=504468 RepID=A0A5M6IIG0_9PROT|nr:hypothetical protein [Rhodovastum atsumiense]KAA5608051.1 hypothetical protein F1189_30930 [Rhodovastum atsumiense]CAH2603461.1 conserved protein of unknown function [Rhodovastum atsumiense]